MKSKSLNPYPLVIAILTYLATYFVLTGFSIVPVSLFFSYSLLPFISLFICLSLLLVNDLIDKFLNDNVEAIRLALKFLLLLAAISSVAITVVVEVGIMNLAGVAAITTLPAIIVVCTVLLAAIGVDFILHHGHLSVVNFFNDSISRLTAGVDHFRVSHSFGFGQDESFSWEVGQYESFHSDVGHGRGSSFDSYQDGGFSFGP